MEVEEVCVKEAREANFATTPLHSYSRSPDMSLDTVSLEAHGALCLLHQSGGHVYTSKIIPRYQPNFLESSGLLGYSP